MTLAYVVSYGHSTPQWVWDAFTQQQQKRVEKHCVRQVLDNIKDKSLILSGPTILYDIWDEFGQPAMHVIAEAKVEMV